MKDTQIWKLPHKWRRILNVLSIKKGYELLQWKANGIQAYADSQIPWLSWAQCSTRSYHQVKVKILGQPIVGSCYISLGKKQNHTSMPLQVMHAIPYQQTIGWFSNGPNLWKRFGWTRDGKRIIKVQGMAEIRKNFQADRCEHGDYFKQPNRATMKQDLNVHKGCIRRSSVRPQGWEWE